MSHDQRSVRTKQDRRSFVPTLHGSRNRSQHRRTPRERISNRIDLRLSFGRAFIRGMSKRKRHLGLAIAALLAMAPACLEQRHARRVRSGVHVPRPASAWRHSPVSLRSIRYRRSPGGNDCRPVRVTRQENRPPMHKNPACHASENSWCLDGPARHAQGLASGRGNRYVEQASWLTARSTG